MTEEQTIINNLKTDLSSKSVEELIYLNFNPVAYVESKTKPLRDQNEQLLREVNNLYNIYQGNKVKYEGIKNTVENYKQQFAAKENELRQLYQQKQAIDNQNTIEGLKAELRNFIDLNYQKPKQKLVNDFNSGKIDLNTFESQFKELNQQYHYYCIIRDKLNLFH